MRLLLSPAAILSLGSLTLLSLADLHGRSLPGIRFYFAASVWFGLAADPAGNAIKVGAVLWAVGWGSGSHLQNRLVFPALFHPAAWPVVLAAAGVRRGLIARGDVLVLGLVACLLPWYGPLLSLVGVYFWQFIWKKARQEPVPALPGMWVGALVAICFGSTS